MVFFFLKIDKFVVEVRAKDIKNSSNFHRSTFSSKGKTLNLFSISEKVEIDMT